MKDPFPISPLTPVKVTPSRDWFYNEEEFLRKTQWLILWRLVFVSFFLLLTVFLQEKEGLPFLSFSFSRLYFLIALQYFFSIIYISLLLWGKAFQWKALIQLLFDGLFVTAVVYSTGGIESFFPYLYFLIILAGGTLFYRVGGLLTAVYVAFLYGLLLSLQGLERAPFYYGLSGHISPYAKKYFIYQIVMHGVGFFLVGYFSSIFAEQTRKQRGQIEIQRENIVQLEELNRIVIENLDIGLITLDYENKIQSINPEGEKILGRGLEELKNKSLKVLFPTLNDYLGPKGPYLGYRLETDYENPEGLTKTLGFSFTRVKEDQSHGIGQILSFKDISQIKIMEDHLRKVDRLAMLGKMAAGIAHEIRNPLASISGSIQVLKDDVKEEGIRERLLKIISREVSRLDSLMNDFLAFAKPVQEIQSHLDITDFIHGTIELVRKNQEVPQTVAWKVDIAPNLIVTISAGELSQVLWNLLMNALQAIPSNGEIYIRTRLVRMGIDEDWVEIRIGDSGPGIPVKDQAKIFEPFYTTKDRGTGLGLSIVQKIISDRGGTIRVDSSPGQGCEFIIHLPGRRSDIDKTMADGLKQRF
jgi:two-component system, NtrC family, sensor histidine kinase PilS